MNIIEAYLAEAADLTRVEPGQDITIEVDLVIAHDVTAPMAIDQFKRIGVQEVFNQDKVVFVVDHIFPAATVEARKLHKKLAEFAQELGIKLYNRAEGVIHQVVAEEEFASRGEIIIGADSHTCTAGAYGALGIPVGSTDLAATMATGNIDIKVPEVDLVYLEKRPPENVSAKDIILNLIGRFGTDGFNDRGIIFAGKGFWDLSLEEKMTICNMCIEMGAMTVYMALEEEEIGEVANEYRFTADEFTEVVACPHSPGNIKPITEVDGLNIDKVVLGSCTNGRISDMRVAAEILQGKEIHPNVTMLVVPASRRILEAMEQEGLTEIFRDSGAVLTNPGCGPCFGAHMGLADKNDVILSTTNRNFPGRMGHAEAQIYLASPQTAVKAAVAGQISSNGSKEGGLI